MKEINFVQPIPSKISTGLRRINNYSLWFLFFLLVYIILLIKTVTFETVRHNLFFGMYSMAITTYILSRFILAYFHKSIDFDERYQPTVSFIVPAKNEGNNIYETLTRFGKVDYPKEKIEVIAINDGSTDHTYNQMLKAQAELQELNIKVRVTNWIINRGKREGMAEGVKQANNEIIIFIDSDSFIEPDCVKHLVKYFIDPKIGAVSGHTDVYNKDKNLLTRMQTVRYYIAFTVYKAAESTFGNVTCCPGCCSAYRKAYLNEFIDKWLNQKFMGATCTYGDDRSLTNFVIRKYKAVYSPMAKAYTVVPEDFSVYLKQQQRWKKSWTRETFIAGLFMWRKNILASLSFYAYIFLAFSSPIVFFRALIWYPGTTGEMPYFYLVGLLLMLLLHGIYFGIKNGDKSKGWLIATLGFWFYTVILMWQLPWAVLTMRSTGWGTR